MTNEQREADYIAQLTATCHKPSAYPRRFVWRGHSFRVHKNGSAEIRAYDGKWLGADDHPSLADLKENVAEYLKNFNTSLNNDLRFTMPKYFTQWGHCPFCMTDQDLLENQSCCTKCDEPLEEGRSEDE